MSYDPLKRPSAAECLQYPFFQVKIPVPLNAPDFESADDILDEDSQEYLSIE
eukprot:CAMPEP_0116873018 /NCGR_PEP_ID=MMETSP0463-20121206/3974_1 /TAXON_ID=181622 /ORGANISM="Strombidinopsis sp, Strain SopsisLIS2011" /LENGTH=51 /DNA_ID=CAMNT_0004514231 /DNA_START=726 /DNA_END=881 /DNA_ORIENTATION=-